MKKKPVPASHKAEKDCGCSCKVCKCKEPGRQAKDKG